MTGRSPSYEIAANVADRELGLVELSEALPRLGAGPAAAREADARPAS